MEREVVLHYKEWEQAGIVPREVWRRAGEQGLLEGWSLGVNAEAPSLELPGARLPPG